MQLVSNERIGHERNSVCSEKRNFAVSMRGRNPGNLDGDKS